MTKLEIGTTLEYIDSLFPSSDWTDDIRRLFRQRAERLALSVDQASAVIDEYRATKRHRSPVLCDLLPMLQRAVMAAKVSTRAAIHPSLSTGKTIRFENERAFAEHFWWAMREDGGPSLEEVIRLATERYGPETAERIGAMLSTRPQRQLT